MIDLEKTLLDICLPLVDDQKALSVKTMATFSGGDFKRFEDNCRKGNIMYTPTAKMLHV